MDTKEQKDVIEVKETKEVKEVKEFKEERFEFALYVNNNIICKRNFKINNFIDNSMQTLDFKYAVDDIVNMINNDLKSKSRVFTWYYGDVADIWQEPLPELLEPTIEPWECTFKFVVSDNKKVVISKIWDGYGLPKSIREKVDIANKTVKITTKDGRVYTYDKDTYFEENKDRLSAELYVLKAMISDKQDLLLGITKKICEVCSPREDGYQNIGDYVVADSFGKNEDGKKYDFCIKKANDKMFEKWGKSLDAKTKSYFKNLF